MAFEDDFTHMSSIAMRDMKVLPLPSRIVDGCYGGDREKAEEEIAHLLKLPDMFYAWLSQCAGGDRAGWESILSHRPGCARMLAMVYIESINK